MAVPPAPPNPRRELMTREIVAQASELFAARGYRATTLQDVAGRLGVTKAALYRYVRSKEDLLRLVYKGSLEQAVHALRTLVQSAASPSEKVRAFILNHAERIATETAAVVATFQRDDDLPRDLRGQSIRLKQEVGNLLAQVIADGVAAGELRTAEPKIAAFAILGMCNWMTRWFHREGRLDHQAVAALFADLALNGLRGSGDARSAVTGDPSGHLAAIRRHTEGLAALLAQGRGRGTAPTATRRPRRRVPERP